MAQFWKDIRSSFSLFSKFLIILIIINLFTPQFLYV